MFDYKIMIVAQRGKGKANPQNKLGMGIYLGKKTGICRFNIFS